MCYVLMKRHVGAVEQFVEPDTIRIGCTPIVNLFEHRCEPIRVDFAQRTSTTIIPDARRPRAFEVYWSRRASPRSTRNATRRFSTPFYSVRHSDEQRERRGFYHIQRQPVRHLSGGMHKTCRPVKRICRLWTWTSIQRTRARGPCWMFAPCAPAGIFPNDWNSVADVPSFSLVARRRPLGTSTVCHPTATDALRPPLDKGTYWRLISHLSLGHVSLFDTEEGATRRCVRSWGCTNSSARATPNNASIRSARSPVSPRCRPLSERRPAAQRLFRGTRGGDYGRRRTPQ